jgi:hypothetical protein
MDEEEEVKEEDEVIYPELEKMRKVQQKSQLIGEFLDWLNYEKKVQLGRFHEHTEDCYDGWDEDDDDIRICGMGEGELMLLNTSYENLLAEFFDIDLKKVDKERRALLDEIRKEAEESGVEV